MAKPQVENGFAMLASELLAAIFIADFAKYEKAVLAEILLTLYGPDKQPTARVDAHDLAATIGVDPRIIRRAVKGLLKKKVILERSVAAYSFVKDWEKWVMDDSPELADDPLNRLVGAGESRFVAHAAARYTAKIPSRFKRKMGTNQSPTHQPDRHDMGTNESPAPTTKGTNESPAPTTKGTGWSPSNTCESYKKLATSAGLPTDSDQPLAGAGAPPSEYQKSREKKNRGSLSTDPPTSDAGGVGFDAQLAAQLDRLRDQVAALMDDDNLALVFRDQVVDWMNCGMLVEDVRQAILLARSKAVGPQNFVPFVSSTARRVRNDRLAERRPMPTLAAVPAEPAPDPAAVAARFKEDLKAIRARGGRPHAG